jgi:hypothetical protein
MLSGQGRREDTTEELSRSDGSEGEGVLVILQDPVYKPKE